MLKHVNEWYFRCGFDPMCFAHQFTEHEKFGCKIIHRNSLAGQNFVSMESNIYLKGKPYCIFLKYLEIGRQGQFKIFN